MSKTIDRSHITDHALIRYMDRVMGIDVEAVREKMDKPGLRAAVKGGASKVTIDGVEFFCGRGKVKTIWNADKDGRMTYLRKDPRDKKANMKRRGGGSHRSKRQSKL